jgi:thymidylate synthase (FAD)
LRIAHFVLGFEIKKIKQMKVNFISISPNAESLIVETARVSSYESKSEGKARLLKYLINHKHWSPFEMADMMVEVYATRDISRQILRHKKIDVQEFSQRYAEVNPDLAVNREARLQDPKNRQNSLDTSDPELIEEWDRIQTQVREVTQNAYKRALELGIAKEQARCVLPEGLTMSRLYLKANIRTWLHYCEVRWGPETQKEHREVAEEIKKLLFIYVPIIAEAFFGVAK